MVKCIAVIDAKLFCFFTKLFANRNKDFPLVVFPKEIKILYFLVSCESSTDFWSDVLYIKLMKFSNHPMFQAVGQGLFSIADH